MSSRYIFNQLDLILPSTNGASKHDTLRLEYLCASKIMDSESNAAKEIIRKLPSKMFELVLQTIITIYKI